MRDRMALLRGNLHISIVDAADLAGVSAACWNSIELGKTHAPLPSTVEKIERLLKKHKLPAVSKREKR